MRGRGLDLRGGAWLYLHSPVDPGRQGLVTSTFHLWKQCQRGGLRLGLSSGLADSCARGPRGSATKLPRRPSVPARPPPVRGGPAPRTWSSVGWGLLGPQAEAVSLEPLRPLVCPSRLCPGPDPSPHGVSQCSLPRPPGSDRRCLLGGARPESHRGFSSSAGLGGLCGRVCPVAALNSLAFGVVSRSGSCWHLAGLTWPVLAVGTPEAWPALPWALLV